MVDLCSSEILITTYQTSCYHNTVDHKGLCLYTDNGIMYHVTKKIMRKPEAHTHMQEHDEHIQYILWQLTLAFNCISYLFNYITTTTTVGNFKENNVILVQIKFLDTNLWQERDSSVSTVKGYVLDDMGLIPRRGKIFFFLFQSIQTSSEAQPPPTPWVTGAFPGE